MASYASTTVLALLAGGLVLVVRSLPRRGLVYQGIDTWFHLKVADIMRQERRVPRHLDAFLVGETYDYPPALSRLLSLIPRQLAERFQWLASPLADAIHGIIIFVAATWLWQSQIAGLAAVGVYLLIPISLGESTELSPRTAGALLVSITLMSAILLHSTGGWPWALCAVLAAAATMLTHRMSTQTMVGLLVTMSAGMRDLAYAEVLVAGLAVALVASRGHYLTVLRGHIAELKFWRQHVALRDDGDPLKLLLGPTEARGPEGRRPTVWAVAYGLIRQNPWVLALAPAYLEGWRAVIPLTPFAWWVAITYAAFLATTYLPSQRFLGHGYRYLAHTALPTAVVAAGYVTALRAAPWVVHAAMAGLVLVGVRETAAHWQRARRGGAARMGDELWAILRRLQELPRDRVLCLPLALANSVAYFTEKRVVRHQSSQAMSRLAMFYPLVTVPLHEVAAAFDVPYILLDARCARGVAPPIAGADEIGSEGPYRLYELTPAAAPSGVGSDIAGVTESTA